MLLDVTKNGAYEADDSMDTIFAGMQTTYQFNNSSSRLDDFYSPSGVSDSVFGPYYPHRIRIDSFGGAPSVKRCGADLTFQATYLFYLRFFRVCYPSPERTEPEIDNYTDMNIYKPPVPSGYSLDDYSCTVEFQAESLTVSKDGTQAIFDYRALYSIVPIRVYGFSDLDTVGRIEYDFTIESLPPFGDSNVLP
jgi:hypothetical protein